MAIAQPPRFYALENLAEARAYLADPTLGPRLIECTDLVLTHADKTATEIFGAIDAAKFRSSMTLFAQAAPGDQVFQTALRRVFNAEPDALTLQILNSNPQP